MLRVGGEGRLPAASRWAQPPLLFAGVELAEGRVPVKVSRTLCLGFEAALPQLAPIPKLDSEGGKRAAFYWLLQTVALETEPQNPEGSSGSDIVRSQDHRGDHRVSQWVVRINTWKIVAWKPTPSTPFLSESGPSLRPPTRFGQEPVMDGSPAFESSSQTSKPLAGLSLWPRHKEPLGKAPTLPQSPPLPATWEQRGPTSRRCERRMLGILQSAMKTAVSSYDQAVCVCCFLPSPLPLVMASCLLPLSVQMQGSCCWALVMHPHTHTHTPSVSTAGTMRRANNGVIQLGKAAQALHVAPAGGRECASARGYTGLPSTTGGPL